MLWAIGVAAEILLFAFSNALLRRLGPPALLMIGAAAGVVRWAVMAVDPPLAVCRCSSRALPERASGTAQALYATVAAGLALGLATIAAGPLYATLGGHSYLAMAGLAAVGLVAAVGVRRGWHGELASCPTSLAVTPTARAAAG